MKIQVFATEAVSDELRDRLSTFALHIYNMHRTGPWMHVASYKVTSPITQETVTRLSTPENPIYAAHCFRKRAYDGAPKDMWIILQPKHPMKNRRFFFADREGGEQ